MENPPYSESGSGGTQNTGKKDNLWKQSFVMSEMKKDPSLKGAVYNDISNLFIWSGFRYYLTKPLDSYIAYSPTKGWRNQNLINKKFKDGFLCDRRQFHTSMKTAVACIWWKNIDDYSTEEIDLTPYNIINDTLEEVDTTIKLQKAKINLSVAYDNREFPDDEQNGILCEANGTEFKHDGRVVRTKPIYNPNIIAYLKADSFAIDRKHLNMTVAGYFKGDGFFIRKDNYLEKLPLFVASVFPYDKYWYTSDVYSKSYDGDGLFIHDLEFLKQCLLYTALAPKNKCRSFKGSDGRFYVNELCLFDDDTIASRDLKRFIENGFELTPVEKNIIRDWESVLGEAELTEEYAVLMQNPKTKLGFWQISEEINLKIDSGGRNKQGKPIMIQKYPMLNTKLKTLEYELKTYYEKYIIPNLFKYQLVK